MWFQYVDCVILDDGGFLVMSNQDDDISKVGHFILLSLTKLKTKAGKLWFWVVWKM